LNWGPTRDLGDGSPPVEFRGKAPAGGLRDGVPQKLEHLYKQTS